MNILKEYVREKKEEATKTKNMQDRQEYLTRNGCIQAGTDQLRKKYANLIKILKEEDQKV